MPIVFDRYVCFFIYAILLLHINPSRAAMSDSEFFKHLNPEHQGIETVRQMAAQGNYYEARQELLSYYKNRVSPNFPGLPDFEAIPAMRLSDSQDKKALADDHIDRWFTFYGVRLYAGDSDGSTDNGP